MTYIAQLGKVQPPTALGKLGGGGIGGIPILLNILLRTLIVVSAVFAIINIILAGYGFISAGGDPKRIADAWAKIWQSLLGLLIAAGAFVLAGVIGQILFGNPDAILRLQYFRP